MSLAAASPTPPAGGGVREVDPSCVGIMEGAFFVGRTELLDWVNSTLALSVSRVEECASGCVYLQALDCLLGPKSRVAMSKVKWGAKHEYEFVHNYKLLQAAFDAHDIHKHIEVNKLIKAKYQDNLEFLQWLKAFCDRQAAVYSSATPYDPIERRKLGVGPFPAWAPVGYERGQAAANPRKPAAAFAASTAAAKPTAATAAAAALRCRLQQKQTGAAAGPDAHAGALQKRQQQQQRDRGDAAAAAVVETLQGELQQAVLERDFYYNKLRRIEILCGTPGSESLSTEKVQAILYAKDEEEILEPK